MSDRINLFSLDNRFELETNGTNYCRNIWREIAENRTDSFWRAVANKKLSEYLPKLSIILLPVN